MTARPRVLVVDDDRNIRATLGVCLESLGCEHAAFAAGGPAVDAAARGAFDLAFVDLRLARESGLDLIPRLLAADPLLRIVLVTAYGSAETADDARRRGAWDYLAKPFTPAQIRGVVERAPCRTHGPPAR